MRAKLWAMSAYIGKPAKDLRTTTTTTPYCDICHEVLGKERLDGMTEYAAILPCSHVFGSLCISRWLEKDSLHQDCPLCRRRMIYRECGHIIPSCAIDRAPKCVREKDMPKKCLSCRRAHDRPDMEFRLRREKRKLGAMTFGGEEEALPRPPPTLRQGLSARIHLPWLRRQNSGGEWNVEEFRRDWRAEIDAIFGNVEEDRRDQW